MMQELILEADRMNLPLVQSFIDEQLEAVDCPMPTRIAIDVAVEELFVNIASYAYGDGTGKAVVQVTVHEDPLSVEITFIDHGKQYDPLAKADPSVTMGMPSGFTAAMAPEVTISTARMRANSFFMGCPPFYFIYTAFPSG